VIRLADADDLDFLNSLIPEVTFDKWAETPGTVAILGGGGAAFFTPTGPTAYEVHCHFAERGRAVRETSRLILNKMRDDYGARFILAPIPDTSAHVKAYVRWLGFKPVCPHFVCGEPGELFLLEM
jgi:hypothetical protein